jgi:hypothetical protein
MTGWPLQHHIETHQLKDTGVFNTLSLLVACSAW